MTAAIEATGLSKRYGRRWALRDCSLGVPTGRIAGLVGPNGAGKTTLLHLAVGLLEPTAGEIRTLGEAPRERPDVMARVGFVAQDVPLYNGFAVGEMFRLGRHLNTVWDDMLARARMDRIGIQLDRRVGTLSGGERAQVALAMALAKRPELLLLDEPLASLDPLARRAFLGSLMEAAAEREVTVLLSSHLVADLERVCDYLVVLSASRVQVLGEVERLLAMHKILIGPRNDREDIAGAAVVAASHTVRQSTLFVRTEGPILDPAWSVQDVTLEDLVLAYLGQPSASALPGPASARRGGPDRMEVRA